MPSQQVLDGRCTKLRSGRLRREVEALIDWDEWNAAKDAERDTKRGFEAALRRWAEVEDPLFDELGIR